MAAMSSSAVCDALVERCPAKYRNVDTWEDFAAESIENLKERKRYLALVEATRLLFAGSPMSAVIAASPVSHRQFVRLYDNAIEFLPDGRGVVGRQAYVLHARKQAADACKSPKDNIASLMDCCPEVYRKVDAWPLFDESRLKSAAVRKRFASLVQATTVFLANQPKSEVLKVSPVGWRQFCRLLRHAMDVKPDKTRIWGFEAFAAWKASNPRGRSKAFEQFGGRSYRAGYSGLFSALLANTPEIEKDLLAFLNRHTRPNKVTPHVLHVEFMRILTEVARLPQDAYPLNTTSQARRPLDKWFKETYLPRYQLKWLGREEGKSAAQVLAYAQGDGGSKLPSLPYTTFSLDEITADVMARYEIPSLLGDWEQLDLRRFAVIRLREITMGITMATRLVLTPQASGEDIAILLYEALSGPPKADTVIPGLDYREGAGYPSNIYEKLRWVALRVVFLDNALSHLKDAVQNILTHLGGGEVFLGAAATPQERAATESELGLLARRLIHQLPGTTGGHPKDPVRKGAFVKLEGRIEVEALVHAIDVYSANSNSLPTGASGHRPPFERLRRLLSTDKLELVRVPHNKRHAYFFSQPIRRVVRASIGDGKHPRAPHINFHGGTFSSDLMKARPNLKGTVLFIRPDYRNLQFVAAFNEDGTFFGMLQAEGYWSRYPNDIRIRKIYATHRNAGRLGERADDQPLQALFKYLHEGAKTDKTKALQLAYVVRFLARNFQGLQLAEMEIEAAIERVGAATRASNDDVEDAVVVQAADGAPRLVPNTSSGALASRASNPAPAAAPQRARGARSGIVVPRLGRS